jgi:NADP-dependent 3-hydroxy acid dehydrogenase YdfG
MEDMAMAKVPYKIALIAGVGPGISASRASSFGAVGVGLAARDVEKLKGLADETGANAFAVDASNPRPSRGFASTASAYSPSPKSSSTTPALACQES